MNFKPIMSEACLEAARSISLLHAKYFPLSLLSEVRGLEGWLTVHVHSTVHIPRHSKVLSQAP